MLMKKLFFVIPNMEIGGTERKVAMLLKYFQKKGYNLTLILFEKKGEQLSHVPSGIRIIELNKTSRWSFLALIKRLGSIISHEKPDKVISFIYFTNIITILVKLLYKVKTEFIISEVNFPRQYLLYTRLSIVKKCLMRFCYKKADKIICICRALSSSIIDDFSISKEKVFTIYNPLDFENIHKLSLEKIQHPFFEMQKTGFKIIIAVGRLSIAKNFDMLLKAFAKTNKINNVLLLILGDGDLKQSLIQLQNDLGLNNSVDFLGYISNPYSWMSRSDLFVLTSKHEGFGSVIIEAMACGIPVISTDCPVGPNEIIENGVNGYLVPVGDISKLSNKINYLINNSDIRKSFVEAGNNKIKDFLLEKIGTEYEKVIVG